MLYLLSTIITVDITMALIVAVTITLVMTVTAALIKSLALTLLRARFRYLRSGGFQVGLLRPRLLRVRRLIRIGWLLRI